MDENHRYALAVLSVFEQADDYESIFWRVTNGNVRFFALCNDLFWWATADCEHIAPEDLPLLRQCLLDLRATDEEYFLSLLFAARKRGLRPQTPYYKNFNEATAALFDACESEEDFRARKEKENAAWLKR